MGGISLESARRSLDEETVLVEESPACDVDDRRLLADPEAAFDPFYEEFAPRLRGLARRFRHAADIAEDLVQEVLLRAYRAEVHLEVGTDPWPWLSTVCRNLAIDATRRRDFRGEQSVDTDTLVSLPAPAELVQDPEAVSVMCGGDVADALALLDAREQRMLLLRHVRGWKYEEIAEWEGISFPALRCALSRARQKLTKTYAAIVEGRGVPAIIGSIFGPVSRRVRALRDRVASGEAALIQQLGTAPPGLANAVAAAVTLGAVAVVGSLLASHDPSPLASSQIAGSTISPNAKAPAPAPPAIDVATGPVSVESVTKPASLAAPPPAGEPESPEAGASAPPPPATVTVDESGATAETDGQTVTVDPTVEKSEDPDSGRTNYTTNPISGEGDRDGDGEPDSATGTPGNVSCPPPEERSLVGSVACPVIETTVDAT